MELMKSTVYREPSSCRGEEKSVFLSQRQDNNSPQKQFYFFKRYFLKAPRYDLWPLTSFSL